MIVLECTCNFNYSYFIPSFLNMFIINLYSKFIDNYFHQKLVKMIGLQKLHDSNWNFALVNILRCFAMNDHTVTIHIITVVGTK